jgi:DedD protein
MVLLAATGFYFFILQPTLREPRTSVPVASKGAEGKGAERPAASAQPSASEAKPAEPAPRPVAPSPSSETPATVDPKPIQVPGDANTHGKFSLQAAAFPNQAGAEEFAEKLKRAGMPSYTVSADLGRRGRWFRVRIGRFNSADDAQKFAGEAQVRAKAVGLSLQLIACQYDQP